LIDHFVAFYREHLDNEHWGESIQVRSDNAMRISMSSQGLSQAESEQIWQPFRDWLKTEPELTTELDVRAIPATAMWNTEVLAKAAPDAIHRDPAHPELYWWSGDGDQVGAYWYAYRSRWLPRALLADHRLAGALFEASRHWSAELHLNKGLGGGNPDAIARSRTTSMNPSAIDATALLIVGAFRESPTEDRAAGERARAAVTAAFEPIAALAPDAGSYANEGDYFEADWQRRFWGANYPRLLAIKHAYDPANVFTCHHCVGSE
jgi:berberine-like enzyme